MEIEKKYLEKPWLRSYELACVPETLEPYPEMTYTEAVLDEPAKKYPNELALVFLDYEMTFRELKEKVDRFATALSDLGVKKGDVVATVIPSSIQFSICDLAIPEIGAIHFPGNPIDSVDALVDKFKRTNCQTVICAHTNVTDRDIIDKIEEVKERTNLKNIILTKLEDFSSKVPEHEREGGAIWLTDLLEKYLPNPPKVDIDPKKDVALLFFTGGATGLPKGVMLSHYNVVSCTRLSLGSAAPQSMLSLMDGLATTIIAAPICHLLGHEFYRYFLTLGLTVLLQSDPRDTKEFVRLAKKYHPVVTPAAATLYMNLAKEEGADNLGILGISGGMPLAPASQADMEKETRSMVAEAHGLSETSGATLAPTAVDIAAPLLGGNKETTGKFIRLLDTLLKTPGIVPLLRAVVKPIGRRNLGMIVNRLITFVSSTILPAPMDKKREITTSCGHPLVDEDFKVVDEDTGEEIPMEKVVKEQLRGEMCVKGPHRMLGYWPNPGTGFDDEGYVHTGDVVKVDEMGRVYIVDRTKDMVNISGYKVYTREMDDMVYEYPGVFEAAAIGVPDPERPGSERIKVFIAPYPEYKGKIKEEDVIEFLKGKVAKYAVPKSVEIRDELPKSPVEKIFKKQLREEEIEKMKRDGILK